VLLLNECLLLFISLSTQSGNFWIQPRLRALDSAATAGASIGKCNEMLTDEQKVSTILLNGVRMKHEKRLRKYYEQKLSKAEQTAVFQIEEKPT
jgi:hypothetical protein